MAYYGVAKYGTDVYRDFPNFTSNWTTSDYYNYYDLNRVERATELLNDILILFTTPLTITTIKNRDTTSFEFYDSLNRLEQNILDIKNATYTPANWITPKTDWVSVRDSFSYVDANRLESNIMGIYNIISREVAGFLYTGDLICGQETEL